MTVGPFSIRPTVEQDWRELRALRLEMLTDTPIAFEETVASAERRSETEWRARAARGSAPTSTTLVAIDRDDAWLGTMGAYVPPGGSLPFIVAVYVTPSARGRDEGVADGLLTAVERWAAMRNDTVALEVHEANTRARRFYERHGFHLTGRTRPYPFDRTMNELEMVKRLDGVAPGDAVRGRGR
jgi:ribosomal protein S18 acetylase RimI-like enzyme